MQNSSWNKIVSGSLVPLRNGRIINTILVVTVILIIWEAVLLTNYRYAKKTIARGVVWGSDSAHAVVSAASGTIRHVMVLPGQKVTAGQPLASVQTGESLQSNFAARKLDLEKQLSTLAQAQSALTLRSNGIEGEAVRAAELFRGQSVNLKSALERRVQRVQQLSNRFARLEAHAGSLSLLEIEQARSELSTEEEAVERLKAEIQSVELQKNGAKDGSAQLALQLSQQASDNNLRRLQLESDLDQLRSASSNEILAPTDGIVSNFKVIQGQLVSAGQVIATLDTASDKEKSSSHVLSARVFLSGAQVGLFKPNAPVWVEVPSFPASDFGIFTAKVLNISSVGSQRDEELNTSASLPFVAEIQMEPRELIHFGRPAFLQHGMSIQAEIIVKELTLFEWLFQPIFQALRKQPNV